MSGNADRRALLDDLFAAIDKKNTQQMLARLSPDVAFRFGAAPAVQRRAPVGEAVDGFFASIAGLRHKLAKIYIDGDTVVCEGNVTYTRHDTSTITLPFANVFEFDGDLIKGYRIYADIAPLYAVAS
ncbi:MAG: nuclear transport factor 2 family protein [Woeseia sp.]